MHKPMVVFDVKNKEHRQYFHNFLNNWKWSACPVRFIIDDDSEDLVHCISKKIMNYYLKKEFDNHERNLHSKK